MDDDEDFPGDDELELTGDVADAEVLEGEEAELRPNPVDDELLLLLVAIENSHGPIPTKRIVP